MEIEKYKLAKEIQSEIEKHERQLSAINQLLQSKNLEAKINGEYHGRFGLTRIDYVSGTEPLIVKILQHDMQFIKNEIELLKNKFKEI